ncbi:hypothetical protein OTU49_007766 [Cherax quadricarinatus]|uniref:C2H2-type domain-containing protein n=1 Tax=Cherax quadricarinatus TaxID=27406 RepID=A0AAW0WG08_CHEQU
MEGNSFVVPGHLPLKWNCHGPPGAPVPGHPFRQEAAWMTPEIRNELQTRNSLREMSVRTGNPEDRLAYQTQCEKVQNMIDKAKSGLGLASSHNSGVNKHYIVPPQEGPGFKNDKVDFSGQGFENGLSEHQYPGHLKGLPKVDSRVTYYENTSSSYSRMTRKPLSCGPCNRTFYSQQRLDEHLQDHVECPFPECKLSAHIKIIDQHINNQHMLINFASLQIDDETWIAERKKRFPSVQRAELRRAEQMEKLKRGERLGKNNRLFNKDKNNKFSKMRQDMTRNRNGSTTGNVKEATSKDRNTTANGSLKDCALSKNTVTESLKDFATGRDKNSTTTATTTTSSLKNFTSRDQDLCEKNELNEGEPRSKLRKKMAQRHERPACAPKASIVVDLYDSDDEFKDGIPAFKGTRQFYESIGEVSYFREKNANTVDVDEDILKETDFRISDDEEWHTENKDANTSSGMLVLGGALGSLMGAYSDSEDENTDIPAPSKSDGKHETGSTHTAANDSQQEGNKSDHKNGGNNQDFTPNEHGAGKRKIRRRPRYHNKGSKGPATQKRPFPFKRTVTKLFPKRRKTLLERLLQADIIHERNVILQCVRFIVQNNFFDANTNKNDGLEVTDLPLKRIVPVEKISVGETIESMDEEKTVEDCEKKTDEIVGKETEKHENNIDDAMEVATDTNIANVEAENVVNIEKEKPVGDCGKRTDKTMEKEIDKHENIIDTREVVTSTNIPSTEAKNTVNMEEEKPAQDCGKRTDDATEKEMEKCENNIDNMMEVAADTNVEAENAVNICLDHLEGGKILVIEENSCSNGLGENGNTVEGVDTKPECKGENGKVEIDGNTLRLSSDMNMEINTCHTQNKENNA